MPGLNGPKDVMDTTRQLVESGVAQLLLDRQEHLMKDVSIVIFWAESSKRGTYVVAKSKDDGQVIAFKAERGLSFGTLRDAPLSDTQMDVVEQLAARYQVR